jgi:hypothetical protein
VWLPHGVGTYPDALVYRDWRAAQPLVIIETVTDENAVAEVGLRKISR